MYDLGQEKKCLLVMADSRQVIWYQVPQQLGYHSRSSYAAYVLLIDQARALKIDGKAYRCKDMLCNHCNVRMVSGPALCPGLRRMAHGAVVS